MEKHPRNMTEAEIYQELKGLNRELHGQAPHTRTKKEFFDRKSLLEQRYYQLRSPLYMEVEGLKERAKHLQKACERKTRQIKKLKAELRWMRQLLKGLR